MIQILLVDDQKLIREGLKALLEPDSELDVVGTADNGHNAIEQVEALHPDIALIDIEMPDINGLEATQIICQKFPSTKVIVLSSYDSDEYVTKSLCAGAKGYLLKNTPAEELREAIRSVHRGYAHIGPGLIEKIIPIVPESNGEPAQKLLRSSASRYKQIHSGKEMGWFQVLILLLFAVGLTAGIYFIRQRLREPLPSLSQSEQAEKIAYTEFTGRVKPAKTFKLSTPTPSVVENIYVQIGQRIKAGQALLTLKNLEADRATKQVQQQQQAAQQQQQMALQQQQMQGQQILELEQKIRNFNRNLAPLRNRIAEANLRLSIAESRAEKLPLRQRQDSIERTRAMYELARSHSNRFEKLYQEGATSKAEFEQVRADLMVAKADFDVAKAAAAAAVELEQAQKEQARLQRQLSVNDQQEQLRQLEEQLQLARLQYKQSTQKLEMLRQQLAQLYRNQTTEVQTVKASKDGVVVELPVAAGDQLFAGNTTVSLAEMTQLKVEVLVNARLINALRLGQRAVVEVGAGTASEEFEATIDTINPLAAENQTHKVEVQFENPTDSLLVGQAATVYFLPK